MGHFHDTVHAKILKNISTKAKNSGFRLQIYASYEDIYVLDESDYGDIRVYEDIDMSAFCAVIIFSETIKKQNIIDKVIEKATEANIPAISLEREEKGCYCVLFDHGDAFEDIVRHVIEHHKVKRVDLIAGMRDNDFSETRIQVYRDILTENGIEVDENRIKYGNFWKMPALEAAKELLEYDIPEAIICANDAMAVPVCQYVESLGYKVPEDIIITGYDGLDSALFNIPSITTAGPIYKNLAEACLEMITSIILGSYPSWEEAKPVAVTNTLIKGQSCGCMKPTLEYYSKRIAELSSRLEDQFTHSHNMFRMVNKACTKGFTVEEIMRSMPFYMHPMLKCKFMYLCAYDNYMDLGENNPGDETDCTILFEYMEGENFYPMKRIKSKDILPDFDSLLRTDCAIIVLPIHYKGDILGYMCVGHDPNEIEYVQLRSVGLNINNIFGNTNTQRELRTINEKLEHMYNRDALTNLFNRRGFYDELAKYKLTNKRKNYLVASIDLNGLKYINDNYGHAEGDYAIVAIAKLIEGFDEADRIVARIGGDEYVMFVASDTPKEKLEKLVEDYLIEGMERINERSGKKYEITGSYGLAVDAMKNIDRFEEVLKLADDIMYIHKRKRYLR